MRDIRHSHVVYIDVVNNAKKNRASEKNILKRIKYSIMSGLIFGLIVWIYCMQTAKTEIAIFLSVFCVLVFSPIAYFKVFWGIKDEISFKEINKTNIKYSSRANHIYNGISVGGNLYLTNNELIFQTNLINFTQKHEFLVNLTEIKIVSYYKTLGIIENGIQIESETNIVEKFIVPQKEKWLNLIKKEISG